MIKIVKADFDKLKHLHEKSAKKKKFTRKKPDPVRIQKQLDDIKLIEQHLMEIEELDKRRHKKDRESKKKAFDIPDSNGDDDLAAKIMMATALPDDPTKSNLPVIDISAQMMQVDNLNKKIDEHADILGEKLVKLKEAALDINGELTTQQVMLENLEEKVEKEIERLKALNERVDTALDKIGGSMKLICIVAIIIVIVAMVGVGAIFVISYFK
jgi:chromosome segregation ATPase